MSDLSWMYSLPAWRALRAKHLKANPYCVMCQGLGLLVRASIVDHRIPHRGDRALFLDAGNLQSLCKPHHDAVKQAFERSGVLRGADASGMPLDPKHHWNRQR